jgi:hypothetical protein
VTGIDDCQLRVEFEDMAPQERLYVFSFDFHLLTAYWPAGVGHGFPARRAR